jgi:hypothetical protein
MKKIVALLVVSLAALAISPASANTQKTLVIIDSGINTELDWVKSTLVEEVCIIEYGTCPNGQKFMNGPGAAHVRYQDVKDRAMHHGSQMYSVAVQVDPNVRVVFIRIVGMSAKGFANSYTMRSVQQALDWVDANAARLNVGVVSMSVGRSYKEAGCPIEANFQATAQKLSSAGIAVVASAGNGGNKTKVDYPACTPEVISVGATDVRYSMRGVVGWVTPVMPSSNGGPDLDLYAHGRWTTQDLTGRKLLTLGTSNSAVAVATKTAQSLSQGGSISSLTQNLGKAHISLKEVVDKLYLVSNS